MAFWGTDLGRTDGDPKRKFRWRVSFGDENEGTKVGDGTIIWFAKTVTKPEMTVGETEHKFLGHTFKYPGSVSWNDIELSLVDPVSPDAARQTLQILHSAGYRFPNDDYLTGADALKTMSKGNATKALKPFIIEQLNGDGEVTEKWELHNPFVVKVGFGDLDYTSDDLSEISMTIKYDWAEFSSPTVASSEKQIFHASYSPVDGAKPVQ